MKVAFRSKVVSTSDLESANFNSGDRSMSGNVGNRIGTSGVVENMRVVAESSMILQSIEKKYIWFSR